MVTSSVRLVPPLSKKLSCLKNLTAHRLTSVGRFMPVYIDQVYVSEDEHCRAYGDGRYSVSPATGSGTDMAIFTQGV